MYSFIQVINEQYYLNQISDISTLLYMLASTIYDSNHRTIIFHLIFHSEWDHSFTFQDKVL